MLLESDLMQGYISIYNKHAEFCKWHQSVFEVDKMLVVNCNLKNMKCVSFLIALEISHLLFLKILVWTYLTSHKMDTTQVDCNYEAFSLYM